jgi:membrane protein
MGGGAALRRVTTEGPHLLAIARETEEGFRKNDLLTYASAIAFQVVLALAPFTLLLVGLMGFFHLDSVWSANIAPDLKPNVSPAAFTLIDDTVHKVLGSKRIFWVTGGLALAIWEISGAVRAVMGALDGIYGVEHERSLKDKLVPSLLLSAAVGILFVAAAAVVRFVPILLGDHVPLALVPILFVARWALAGAFLAIAVGLLVRHCPYCKQPLPWVSFGTGLVIVAWTVMSIGYGIYLTEIASYGSIFGQLATFFVTAGYVYYSSVAFLGGLQVDAVIRDRVDEVQAC